MGAIYQKMGLLVSGAPMPFVAQVSFLPAKTADSTLVLVSVSLPTIGLTFSRDTDTYRGGYSVAAELRQGSVSRAFHDDTSDVRLSSFKETQRTDESLLYSTTLTAAPGTYNFALLVRDKGSTRSATRELDITVPRITNGPSSPVLAVEAQVRTSLAEPPGVVVSPRSTAIFGRDGELPMYIEVRDSSPQGVPLQISIDGENAQALYRDSVVLPRRGALAADVVRIPVTTLGVGVMTAKVWRAGSPDTASQRVMVSLGEDLPVASFDELLSYLRFFASSTRLAPLRSGAPQARAAAWAAFLQATDPNPGTPQNEALRDYLTRVRVANDRFRDDGLGWLSDRGMTYVALGDPDFVQDQTGSQPLNRDVGQRGRTEFWTYNQERVRLVFVDVSGFGRWRFAGNSQADFNFLLNRRLSAP
jgi:GWxTD domain-containing protein